MMEISAENTSSSGYCYLCNQEIGKHTCMHTCIHAYMHWTNHGVQFHGRVEKGRQMYHCSKCKLDFLDICQFWRHNETHKTSGHNGTHKTLEHNETHTTSGHNETHKTSGHKETHKISGHNETHITPDCGICNDGELQSSFPDHTHEIRELDTYPCYCCDASFMSSKEQYMHLLRYHRKYGLKCKYCEGVYESYPKLMSHLQGSFCTSKMISCDLCKDFIFRIIQFGSHTCQERRELDINDAGDNHMNFDSMIKGVGEPRVIRYKSHNSEKKVQCRERSSVKRKKELQCPLCEVLVKNLSKHRNDMHRNDEGEPQEIPCQSHNSELDKLLNENDGVLSTRQETKECNESSDCTNNQSNDSGDNHMDSDNILKRVGDNDNHIDSDDTIKAVGDPQEIPCKSPNLDLNKLLNENDGVVSTKQETDECNESSDCTNNQSNDFGDNHMDSDNILKRVGDNDNHMDSDDTIKVVGESREIPCESVNSELNKWRSNEDCDVVSTEQKAEELFESSDCTNNQMRNKSLEMDVTTNTADSSVLNNASSDSVGDSSDEINETVNKQSVANNQSDGECSGIIGENGGLENGNSESDVDTITWTTFSPVDSSSEKRCHSINQEGDGKPVVPISPSRNLGKKRTRPKNSNLAKRRSLRISIRGNSQNTNVIKHAITRTDCTVQRKKVQCEERSSVKSKKESQCSRCKTFVEDLSRHRNDVHRNYEGSLDHNYSLLNSEEKQILKYRISFESNIYDGEQNMANSLSDGECSVIKVVVTKQETKECSESLDCTNNQSNDPGDNHMDCDNMTKKVGEPHKISCKSFNSELYKLLNENDGVVSNEQETDECNASSDCTNNQSNDPGDNHMDSDNMTKEVGEPQEIPCKSFNSELNKCRSNEDYEVVSTEQEAEECNESSDCTNNQKRNKLNVNEGHAMDVTTNTADSSVLNNTSGDSVGDSSDEINETVNKQSMAINQSDGECSGIICEHGGLENGNSESDVGTITWTTFSPVESSEEGCHSIKQEGDGETVVPISPSRSHRKRRTQPKNPNLAKRRSLRISMRRNSQQKNDIEHTITRTDSTVQRKEVQCREICSVQKKEKLQCPQCKKFVKNLSRHRNVVHRKDEGSLDHNNSMLNSEKEQTPKDRMSVESNVVPDEQNAANSLSDGGCSGDNYEDGGPANGNGESNVGNEQTTIKIICIVCDEIFPTEYRLNTHMKKKHTYEKPVQNVTVKSPCHICGKLLSIQSMALHLQSHDPTPVKTPCRICGKFQLKRYMSKHLRLHNLTTICHICGCGPMSDYYMNRHIAMRHTEPRFACPVELCGKKFKNSRHLHLHKRRIHDRAKDFVCTSQNCDRAFGSRSALIYHRRQHTGEKPHKCKFCDYSSIQNVCLRLHMKNHHEVLT